MTGDENHLPKPHRHTLVKALAFMVQEVRRDKNLSEDWRKHRFVLRATEHAEEVLKREEWHRRNRDLV